MSQAPSNPTPSFRGKLARSILLTLLPLTLIPVIILAVIVFQSTARSINNQLEARFEQIALAQQAKINDLVTIQVNFMAEIMLDSAFTQGLAALLSSDRSDPLYVERQAEILAAYNRNVLAFEQQPFDAFVVLDPTGSVLAASETTWQDQELTGVDVAGLVNETIISHSNTPPLISQKFHTLTSQPYRDANGEVAAILVGFSYRPYQEMLELALLSFDSARAYYVNSDGSFIGLEADSSNMQTFQPAPGQAEKLNAALPTAAPGTLLKYESFDNQQVQASLLWLPAINSGLAVEVPQEIIIQPLTSLRNLTIILLTSTLIVMALVIYLGSRRVINPILDVAHTAQQFAEGDLEVRAKVQRQDEIGLLAHAFNRVADRLVALYRSLESVVDARSEQIRTAAEVAQLATSAANLDQILRRTVNLIVERFNYYHAAIYLLDRDSQTSTLRAAAGAPGVKALLPGFQVSAGSRSIIGWVSANNQAWVANDVRQDPYYMPSENLPETRSEVGLPLSVGGKLLGVLDVQSSQLEAFDVAVVDTLQTLANQIASTLQNVRLLESARSDLQATSLLYEASHHISTAATQTQVFEAVAEIIHQLPHASALFMREDNGLRSIALTGPDGSMITQSTPLLPVSQAELGTVLETSSLQIFDMNQSPASMPASLWEVAQRLGSADVALLPIWSNQTLTGLLLVGSMSGQSLQPSALEPYASVLEIANTTLAKIEALERTTEQLSELQTINTVSQSISTQTDLYRLYEVIHQQIQQLMGDVNFLIALFDAEQEIIQIPYMDDGSGEIISPEPFPLGQGLTSILIRTRQPLMIVEDSVNRMRALGAIMLGEPAKSWLGVPLLVGGNVIGAMVVQDLQREQRFNDDDMRLMMTLAGQVASAVDNARLLSTTQAAADRDRALFEITSKIRRANDMQSILAITTEELARALKLRHASIRLSPEIIVTASGSDGEAQEEASE